MELSTAKVVSGLWNDVKISDKLRKLILVSPCHRSLLASKIPAAGPWTSWSIS
jgi:hypothetical protein